MTESVDADAMRIDRELEGVRSFGTQMAATDRALWIAFDVDELSAFAEDEMPQPRRWTGRWIKLLSA